MAWCQTGGQPLFEPTVAKFLVSLYQKWFKSTYHNPDRPESLAIIQHNHGQFWHNTHLIAIIGYIQISSFVFQCTTYILPLVTGVKYLAEVNILRYVKITYLSIFHANHSQVAWARIRLKSRQFDFLFNRLFRLPIMQTQKLRITGHFGGNSPVTGFIKNYQ